MTMAPYLTDYHQRRSRLRSLVLKNEEERLELEQKLRSLATIETKIHQRQKREDFDDEFQHADQRNRRLRDDLSRAQLKLNQIKLDAEKLMRLRRENVEFIQTKKISQPYDFDRTPRDDFSQSDSTSFSRSKRTNSLRMELTRTGLFYLLDYLENEFRDSIDKKKFYQHDPPTLTQKRTILTIGNERQERELRNVDPTTVSMVILDQLASTIRRTTVKQCLLTEEILSGNVVDLDVQTISRRIPESDQILWNRLIEHLIKLVRNHIITPDVLAQKFASAFIPVDSILIQDKTRSLLKHLVEHQPTTTTTNPTSTQSSWLTRTANRKSFDDEFSSSSSSSTKGKVDESDDDFFG